MPFRKSKPWGSIKPQVGSQLDYGDPINNGLIYRFLFNEGGGKSVRSIANPAIGAFQVSSQTFGPGKFGNTLKFASANIERVIVPVNSGLFNASALTHSFWAKSNIVDQSYHALFVGSSNGDKIYQRSTSDVISFYNNGGFALDSTFAPTAGRWFHAAITYDGATLTWYINGVFNASTAYSTAIDLSSSFNWSDDATGTRYWDGGIDDWLIYRRCLKPSEIARLYSEPYAGIVAPRRRIISAAAGGGSGSTGTVAKTNANDTSAASGTTTVTGTLARTNANDTSAASGTTKILGTLARTNANDTSAASGTTTVTGTLARTNANDTSAASGSPIVNGSLATTNANDTVVASGSSGSSVSGSVAKTNANDTSAASGTTTVLGTLATTNANDTSSAAGTTKILGALAYTNADDTVVASGAAGLITGTVAYTNNDDTCFAYDVLPVTDTPVIVDTGVKRKPIRVRRSDFSSQSNYEAALKAAMAGQFITEIEPEPVKPVQKKPKIVVTDTAIKVSAEALLALQKAADMEEMELIKTFIEAIESEYGD